MKKTLYLPIILMLMISVFSYSQSPQIKKESVQKTDKRLATLFTNIPAGNWKDNNGENQQIDAFQLGMGTVTNLDYREFIVYLKNNGKLEEYHAYYPDSTVWGAQQVNFGSVYFKHSAYRDYPVVGITKRAAIAYAEWLGQQNRIVSENQNIEFRLPTKNEWIYAASAGNINNVYAWNGPYLRNEKGMFMANFRVIGEQNISKDKDGHPIVIGVTINQNDNDISIFTVKSKSYYPSIWNLYNMNGNVSEMLLDVDEVIGGSWDDYGHDIRNNSVKPFDGNAKSTVGFRLVRVR